MRVVLALGGNALQRRNEPNDLAHRQRNLQSAARAVAAIARHHQVIVTHGNGPQVGMLALAAAAAGSPDPLDVLVAESEGMIGYLIERELARELPQRDIATLLTEVEVDAGDPAFATPSKPIGPCYSEVEAWKLMTERSWRMIRDGNAMRRAVPSPEPRRIRALSAIKILIEAGAIVICSGGGGIPVVALADGSLRGIEAVIDKDLSAALLAEQVEAEALLMLTDVPAVATDFGNPSSRNIVSANPAQLRQFHFAPGSMGPKIEAACRFVERTGNIAAIGALEDAEAVLAGTAGTLIRRDSQPVRYHA